jgi:pimeloyl-ACP methyl ester carboxylesterase
VRERGVRPQPREIGALFAPISCRQIARHFEWERIMAETAALNNSVAAQLSQAAYDTLGPDNLPAGWTDDFQYYFNNGTNSFSTFVNAATQQVVIAFEGTQSEAQLESDVANAGGSAWESIKGSFANILSQIRSAFPDWQIATDGHSLGGGMAQTAALENDLSGFAQNSLPISPAAIRNINHSGGLRAALSAWKASGATFSEATISGDITTIAYAGGLNLYSNGTTSGDTSTAILPNIYAGLENDAANLAANFDFSASATVYALAAEGAHSIANVINELSADPSATPTVPVVFLTTDQSDLNALPSGFNIEDTATNVASGFNALGADVSHVKSIAFSDAGAPVLNIDFSQAWNASLLSKITGSYDLLITGVTGHSFDSYQVDYVDGLQAATEYFTPAGQNQTVETDYSPTGAYLGERLTTTGIQGQFYTSDELDVGAHGHFWREILSGVSGQPYTAVEDDYNGAGTLTGVTYDVTSAPEDPYANGRVHDDASGNLQWETAALENGGNQITGVADGVRLVSHGDDVMTGGGSSEKFVLNAIFGADVITDFASHASGADHDVISLSRSDFQDFAAVLASATDSGGNAVLHTANNQTLTLLGVDVATLSQLSTDFTFHR